MRTPFLSHRRTDGSDLSVLHGELKVRGVGGWRDVENLGLGEPTRASIRRAIRRETGGFIWLGTAASLESEVICGLELPLALRRRRFGRTAYPLVPLFVDIEPGDERITAALGPRRARRLRDLNGLVKADGESIEAFSQRAAGRYVADAVCSALRRRSRIRVQVIGQGAPVAATDIVLDWRELLVDGRPSSTSDLAVIGSTLGSLRSAVQECGPHRSVAVEANLRLPLAALVGWELGAHAQIDLTVVQRSGAAVFDVSSRSGVTTDWPEPVEHRFGQDGPTVIAVSVIKNLAGTVARYAETVGASRYLHLHLDEPLDAAGVRGLANWTVQHLATFNDAGERKHLLLLGPSALAAWIGHIAHGTGKTTMPIWDGADGYAGSIEIG